MPSTFVFAKVMTSAEFLLGMTTSNGTSGHYFYFLVLYKGTFRRGQGDQVHCASPPHDYEDCGKVAIQLSFMLIMWAQLTQNVTGDIYGTNMKSLLARKESVEDE